MADTNAKITHLASPFTFYTSRLLEGSLFAERVIHLPNVLNDDDKLLRPTQKFDSDFENEEPLHKF